ncbi:thiazole synthase [Acetobacteraceae bacterium ESL0709]|nr:thiazole synthase [Acetobacteraceae bacterium ESL0697]MDF7678177.1 thiazole synthase [Acetobacteraceae bacterium ESL0709]
MPLGLYGSEVSSRFLLGTARYPSPAMLEEAIREAGVDIVTVSLRRESLGIDGTQKGSGQAFWSLIRETGARILPNTAGCHSVREAVTTAHMAREVMGTNWIKLEVIADDMALNPDVFGLVEAARILTEEGFSVFPYTTADLGVGERLLQAGCQVLMPWAAPIGSGQGLSDINALKAYRQHFATTTLIIDAGIGRPSQAADAMEMGYDAVLLNSAVARAGDPVLMARAFALAIEAGRAAYKADPIEPYLGAMPSSPLTGMASLS